MGAVWSQFEIEEEHEMQMIILILESVLGKRKMEPEPYHTSVLTGEEYYKEIMNSRNEHLFNDTSRMKKETFEKLVKLLTTRGGLRGSYKQGKHTVPGQKLMMLIDAVVGKTNRQINIRWQLSGSTVHNYIDQVCRSFLRCKDILMICPTIDTPLSERIANDPKFFPYFDNCLGALDGTHVEAIVGEEEKGAFRNRKGDITQNVLGVANFDLTFAYILTGWEGSAHDGRVLDDAKRKGLPIFPLKYYLGDAGYALTNYCLTPYRGVRYHLREWVNGDQRPQSKEELFNLRHSSLRNVIERIFGVMKKRFPLLQCMHSYPFKFQCKLIKVCALLHNFIRMNQLDDEFDVLNDEDVDQDDRGDRFVFDDSESTSILHAWRDGIAQRMWDDYLRVRNERGLN